MAYAMRERKTPARMALAKDVGRSRGGMVMRQADRPLDPYANMNQTQARLPSRLEARVKRGRESSQQPGARPKVAEKRDKKPLVHALKMQQTLTPLSFHQRDKLKETLEKIQSFEQFDLLTEVRDAIYNQALEGLTEVTPTPIQKLGIPALLSKKGLYEKSKKNVGNGPHFSQFLLAAETGSGKTLAYLAPIIDAVKRQEEAENAESAEQEKEERNKNSNESVFHVDPPAVEEEEYSKAGRPRAIILLPSSELVSQVGKVVKSMSHTVKYKSAPISSTHTPTVIRSRLFNPNGIDILVSTPHLVGSIAEKEPNILSQVTHLVIDEADSLFDRSFAPITSSIIDRASPSLKQLILCSATIPRSLDTFMDKRFPQIKRLVTPKLHTIPRRVQLGMVDVDRDPFRGNKSLACADVIWQIGKSTHEDTETHHVVKPMIVFVNERETANELAEYLVSKGIEAVPLTRDTPEQRQSDILAAFTSWSRVAGDEKPPEDQQRGRRQTFSDFLPFASDSSASASKPAKHLPNVKVLVTTDLGSRGLDTMSTRFVILHGIPHTTIDFIHRIGRLGRMGRRGRAVALVDKNDRKDVVAEVRRLAFRGMPLI